MYFKFKNQDQLLFPEILWELPQNVYKRQRGKILIIAGSKGMAGAAALVCEATFRSGAGIVVLGFPETLTDVYKKILPEAMTMALPATPAGSLSLKAFEEIKDKSKDFDVIAIGPGLSLNPETVQLIWELVFTLPKIIILDADGIGAFSTGLKVIREKQGREGTNQYISKIKNRIIFTPHPGEAVKLLQGLEKDKKTKITSHYIDKNRVEIGKKLADDLGNIVVLKGNNTVIAKPNEEIIVNKSGNVGMATAGSGDVLVGIISALVAQNLKKIFESTAVAVYIHGLAGDLSASQIGQRSIIASDIIKFLPEAIKKAEKEIS